MEYIGKIGKKYSIIEPALGKGGEGSVYKIVNMQDYVLKVFNEDKRTETRHKKLLTMITTSMPLPALQQVAWPIDVVYQKGQFVGYVMPLINNIEELNVIYSDKYVSTLSERITIARNLCAAINAVHNAGQVCGDLNPKNIGVNPQSARVTLVDTDSYHITDSNGARVYRCEMGVPEYLAKEIQVVMKNNPGKTLATVPGDTFSKETDLFALAIHIFALLMNGCHPFACATTDNKTNIGHLSFGQPSVVCPQPIENILNGYFPFYIKRDGLTKPLYAPEFSSLPKNVQGLFVRAFIGNPSQRPNTEEWFNALTVMQQNLSVCSKNSKHIYSSHLNKCPWCELEFGFVSVPRPTAKTTNAQLTQTKTNIPTANNYVQRYSPPTAMVQNKSNTNNYGNLTSNTQQSNTSSFSFWKWLVAVILVIILFSILRSCFNTSENKSIKSNYAYNAETNYDVDNDGYSVENHNSSVSQTRVTPTMVPSYVQVSVPDIEENILTVENAVPLTYSGNITYEDQCDTYSFTPPYDGCYRLELSGIPDGNEVHIYAYEDSSYAIESEFYCCNGDGITLSADAGITYEIIVEQETGLGAYNLNIGQQKLSVDVSTLTQVIDSIEFTEQTNIYLFTAPFDGCYRFELSGMPDGNEVHIYAYEDSPHTSYAIESEYYCCNGDGITLSADAGITYEIIVEQETGLGAYNLNIGQQKPSIEVGTWTRVTDSVEFTEQNNVYLFIAPVDGNYQLELSGIPDGNEVHIYAYEDSSYTPYAIESEYYCSNGDGITLSADAGITYEIIVEQETGFGAYTLTISGGPSTSSTNNNTPNKNPSPTPTPTSNTINMQETEEFVSRCYELVLNRDPDEEGLNYWTDALVNNRATGTDIAYGLFFSQEYSNFDTSNEEFVTTLYCVFLAREPDPIGLNDWISQLDSGVDRLSVFRGFANSDEYAEICAVYGIERGLI